MSIKTMNRTDPITGTTIYKNERFFEFGKVVYSKDDTAGIIRMLKRGGFYVMGKKAFNDDGSLKGFKCSAKCRPDVAIGHNRREQSWIEDLDHIDPTGHYRTILNCGSLEKCYEQIFGEALEEYNKTQRNDRKIKNYLTHILEDQRRGSMKKKSTTDNSRKPWYEFIFQIGKRDNRLDTDASIAILEKFATEWMPKHYPNLKAVGIYLHADEFTLDPVTGEKLPGSVHIHFDFIPVCHALTKEEQEEEDRLREEMKQEEIERCKKAGIEFDEKKWKKKDWTPWRVEHFGKALQSGMSIQSSISGACAEMGFRTKGKLTAQIQMEEAVRNDLLDMVENYGIKVDRKIEEDHEEEVKIQLYKEREDNKALLEENQRLLKIIMEQQEQNQMDAAKNKRDKTENEQARIKNAKEAKANALTKAANEETSAKLSVLQKKVDDIDSNLEVIKEWTENHAAIESSQNRRAKIQDEKDKEQDEREKFLNNLHDETFAQKRENEKKETELKSLIQNLKDEQKADEKRKHELELMSDNLISYRRDYKNYEYAHDFMERSKTDINSIEKDFWDDEKLHARSTKENLTYMFGRVKDYISHLYIKFEESHKIWTEYFYGKKSEDLRKLVSDMDAHGVENFENYHNLRMEGKLKWQLQALEQETQHFLKSVKKRDVEIER